jgi:hypothetical protein
MPIYGDGVNASFHGFETMTHKADMKEVERLLICEAEKRGFHSMATFKDYSGLGVFTATGEFSFTSEGLMNSDYIGCIFHFKIGKWAEIIEEKKKPTLYKIRFSDSKIVSPYEYGNEFSKEMTKKECYQYLADRCEE